MNRDVLFTMLARLVVVACGVLSSIVVAHLLGAVGQGEYYVVVTFAQLVAQFSNLGIHSSNTYLASHDESRLRGLAANSLWVSLLFGPLVALLSGWMLSAVGWLQAASVVDLCLGMALVPPMLYVLFGGSLLVAVRRFAAFNAFHVCSSLLISGSLLAAWLASADVTSVLATSAAAWWCSAAALHFLVSRTGHGSWRFRPSLLREGLQFAGKAYLTCLIGFFLARANVFFLKNLCGSEQAGYYSIAVRVADAMWILPSAVTLVLFPRLVREQHSRWDIASRLLVRMGLLMGLACVACALLIGPFVQIALGAQFLPSVDAVRWMLPGIFFYALTSVISQYLAASGFPSAVVGIWMAALGILAVASWSLVPIYGSAGAAAALSIANGSVFAMQLALALSMQAAEATGREAAGASAGAV